MSDVLNPVRKRMEEIIKKYPTIGDRTNNKKDFKQNRNIFEYIKTKSICDRKRLRQINILNSIVDNEFSKTMNLCNFILRCKKLDILEDIIFKPNEKILVEYNALPLVDVNKQIIEKDICHKFENVDYVFKEYKNIKKKLRKSELEKKIIEFTRERLFKNSK